MLKKSLFVLFFAVLLIGLLVSPSVGADLKVGLVFDIGGKGDQSFNDSAYRGLTWASKKYGINHVEIEPGADFDALRRVQTTECAHQP